MSLLDTAMGWISPALCLSCGAEGQLLCEICLESELVPYGERCFRCSKLSRRSKTCASCRRGGSPNHVWVFTDYSDATQRLIHKYKFIHHRAAARLIANLMADAYMSQNNETASHKKYLIVPVPTAGERVRQRGFDHTALLARELSNILEVPCARALGRLGNAKQIGASRRIRAEQVKGSYYARFDYLINGRNILLIDDVVTTGATLSESASTLRAAGARSVDALVLAKKL